MSPEATLDRVGLTSGCRERTRLISASKPSAISSVSETVILARLVPFFFLAMTLPGDGDVAVRQRISDFAGMGDGTSPVSERPEDVLAPTAFAFLAVATSLVFFLWHGMQRVFRFSSPDSPPPSATSTTWSACHSDFPDSNGVRENFRQVSRKTGEDCHSEDPQEFFADLAAFSNSMRTYLVSSRQTAHTPRSRSYTTFLMNLTSDRIFHS